MAKTTKTTTTRTKAAKDVTTQNSNEPVYEEHVAPQETEANLQDAKEEKVTGDEVRDGVVVSTEVSRKEDETT